MTLLSTGAITSAQINTETGHGTFDMNGALERTLAGKAAGSYAWSDYYGQTKGGTCALVAGVSGTTSSGVYTSTAVSIGEIAWNRRVFCAVHWACVTSAVVTSVSSATIGGVSAAVHRSNGDGGTSATSNYGCALISATVPTGTTAVVTVTFSNATVRTVLVDTYRVTGLVSGTAYATDQAFDETGGAGTAVCASAINIQSTGLAFFAATGSAATAVGPMSTTGISERIDSTFGTDGRYSSGFQLGLSLQSNRPITTSEAMDPTGRLRQVVASFQLL